MSAPTRRDPPHILVIDDDPKLLRLVEMFLGMEGFDVFAASGGEEALQHVASRRPDLVVVDLMIGGMDGFQICHTLKAAPSTRAIPVVIFSALTADADVEAARRTGADRFISKPFSLTGLRDVIRSLV